MNILAVDFDGVIANTSLAKRTWLRREMGFDAIDMFVDRSSLEPVVGASAYRRMQESLGFEDTMSAEPLSNAVSVIERLSRNFSIYVLTARAESKLAWVEAWLAKHGLDSIVEAVVSSGLGSKIEAASQLNASWLIDDDIRHHRAGFSTKFVLFGRTSSGASESVTCAQNWLCVWAQIGKVGLPVRR